jgi:hypothetical protein
MLVVSLRVAYTNRRCSILCHDLETSLLVLAERSLSSAILVDASLCFDATTIAPWLRENKGTVMVAGYYESTEVSSTSSTLKRTR